MPIPRHLGAHYVNHAEAAAVGCMRNLINLLLLLLLDILRILLNVALNVAAESLTRDSLIT
jgi:hypothetical protein